MSTKFDPQILTSTMGTQLKSALPTRFSLFAMACIASMSILEFWYAGKYCTLPPVGAAICMVLIMACYVHARYRSHLAQQAASASSDKPGRLFNPVELAFFTCFGVLWLGSYLVLGSANLLAQGLLPNIWSVGGISLVCGIIGFFGIRPPSR